MSQPLESWHNKFLGEEGRGFGSLMHRMDMAAESLRQLAAWHKARLKMETEYGESMVRLISKYPLILEEGTLKPPLQKYVGSSEMMANGHQKLAEKMNEHVLLLQKQYDEVIHVRDGYHEMMKQIDKSLENERHNIERLQKDLDTKCQEMSKALEITSRGQTANMTKKDYEKVQERAIKAKRDVDKSEQDNLEAVNRWNALQEKWEEKVSEAAQVFQKLDLKRLELTKMTLCGLIDDQMEYLVTVKQTCFSKVKENVQQIDTVADVNEFCAKYNTGSKRAPRLVFKSPFKRRLSLDQLRSQIGGHQPLPGPPSLVPLNISNGKLAASCDSDNTEKPTVMRGRVATPPRQDAKATVVVEADGQNRSRERLDHATITSQGTSLDQLLQLAEQLKRTPELGRSRSTSRERLNGLGKDNTSTTPSNTTSQPNKSPSQDAIQK